MNPKLESALHFATVALAWLAASSYISAPGPYHDLISNGIALALSLIAYYNQSEHKKDVARQTAASIAEPVSTPAPIAKAILVCVLASSLMSCAAVKTLINPATPAQCATTRNVSRYVASTLGGGAVGTSAAALATSYGATKQQLMDVALACSALGVTAVGYDWFVDNVQCPVLPDAIAPAASALQPPANP